MTESWGAIYMPATETNDPSASGFESEEKARAYTRKYWCKNCRNDYAKALRWERQGVDIFEVEKEVNSRDLGEKEAWEAWEDYREKYGDFYPSCDAVWIIDRTDLIDVCETTEDIMRLTGYTGGENDEREIS